MNRHFTKVIVGSGSAGSILAARLSENPEISLLLIEAGPDYTTTEDLPDELKYGYGTPSGIVSVESHDWNLQAKANHRTSNRHIPRGKVIGGSSTVNAQIFLRPHPEDFAMWVEKGNDLWGFQQVLPYYIGLENDQNFDGKFHGNEGPTPVRHYSRKELLTDQAAFYEACRDLGFPDCLDANHPDSTGVGPFPVNNLNRVRQSVPVTYLTPSVRKRANLSIEANSTVHRVLFEGTKAIGIEVIRDGIVERIEANEVILSGGAIGSPQLLMLSGIGPSDHLRALGIAVVADLPGVGQNLCDHPTNNMHWRLRESVPLVDREFWHQMGLRYTSSENGRRNDMIVYPGLNPYEAILFFRPSVNYANGSGELLLSSTNPQDQPILNYRYFENDLDRKHQRECVRLCWDIVQHKAFAEIVESAIKPLPENLASKEALNDWILADADTGHHSSSTCKMGPDSDHMAVVDQKGKVHGILNLRVVDASIFPHCIRANLNATTIMVAERIADWMFNE